MAPRSSCLSLLTLQVDASSVVYSTGSLVRASRVSSGSLVPVLSPLNPQPIHGSKMPRLSRALLLGLQAAALVSTLGPSSAPPLVALAAPLPMPAPPTIRIADYASHPPPISNATMAPLEGVAVSPQNKDVTAVQHTASGASSMQRRQLDILSSITAHLNVISTLLVANIVSAGRLRRFSGDLASRASAEGSDPAFCQQVVSSVTAYKEDLLGFQSFLGESDKGIGNLDPNNQLEEAIKDLVNSVKESLNWIDTLVYNIPGLGPILGPSKFSYALFMDHFTHLSVQLSTRSSASSTASWTTSKTSWMGCSTNCNRRSPRSLDKRRRRLVLMALPVRGSCRMWPNGRCRRWAIGC